MLATVRDIPIAPTRVPPVAALNPRNRRRFMRDRLLYTDVSTRRLPTFFDG
ncbi:hypothetical protein HSB1_21550 [Halogranum salarium B-1]|uniref:Uncharacterized protein n=1 Tax=Halogranum salarium B-1 TaxID=1210908 RepID=J3EXS5_9EURY|nr:hypothetical protein HSB1_21550 [Halogranum salarium B-1]